MPKFLRTLTFLTLFAALAFGGWWWWSKRTPALAAEDVIPDHQIAEASRRQIESKLTVYGDVAPAFQVEVKSEVGGKVKKIHAQPGDQVKRGQLLMEIDDAELQNEKAAAMAEVEGAQLEVEKTSGNFERAAALYEEALISKEIYENLEADLKIAQNKLDRADRRLQIVEERLSKTFIHAPANGTVLTLYVQEGQVVSAAASVNSGTSLMMVADLDRLLVHSHVNQVDVARIQQGKRVFLASDTIPGERMPARISFIAPVASRKNDIKGFAIEVAVERVHPMIRPGMTVSVNVPLGKADDAITVPVGAVFEDEEEGQVVWVVNEQRRAEKRRVDVGLSDLFFAEIKDGVEPGESILLVPPSQLALVKSS